MALPLRDARPPRRHPWVTTALIVVNVVVFLFVQPAAYQYQPDAEGEELFSSFEQVAEAERFAYRWGAVPCELFSGDPLADRPARCEDLVPPDLVDGDKPVLGALLTSMFLHGSALHLAGNMLYLWVFGTNVEDRLGRRRYLGLYLVGGVLATLGYAAVNPDGAVPLVGASGAIAAAMGAYLVLHPRGRVLAVVATAAFQVVYVPAAILLALFFVTQFFTPDNQVAWEAHVAGMVAGVLGALALGRLPSVRRRQQSF